jgi:sugar phosphate isomerase/epimerase
MKSAVTLCHVPEAAAGPFVFHGPLANGFENAARLGFDAVELFLPAPDAYPIQEILDLAAKHHLAIAAVGTGAGMVKHGLSLTDPSPARRTAALDFLKRMIHFGGQLNAPAILGSMQGKAGGDVSHPQALDWLAGALLDAANTAASHNVPFIYEPLNRYESNLINRQADALTFLDSRAIPNTVILADLFHMNIEEPDLPAALRAIAPRLGHVHFADSNRQAIGHGHTNPAPILATLREISYSGYLSAEILPLPNPETAAQHFLTSLHP